MSASFSITIQGKGTFTASIADPEASVTVGTNTPASFTAEVAPVGPAGPAGAAGATGVVYATSPITYDSGTQTVALDRTAENTAIESAFADGSIKPNSIRTNAIAFGTTGIPTIQNEAYSSSVLTPYLLSSTAASTYLVKPTVAGTDGQILSWDGTTSLPVWIANDASTVFTTGTNKTGSTLSKGTIVYINGAQGSKFTIAKAKADADGTSAQTLGVVSADIANNAAGTIITFGEITGLDTSAYADGTQLYLSGTTAGIWTSTKPVAPIHIVYVAVVSYSHAVNGKVLVKVQNGYELEEIHDVLITSKADKDLLTYDSASGLWKNKTFSTLGLATETYVTSQGYITSSALSPYLTSATAASTYQTQAGMSSYLTTASASSTYLTQANAASTYQTQAGMSSYATLASPTFTGDPKAPTPSAGDNDTSIATTAFVTTANPDATTSVKGHVQLATQAETDAGTNSTKAITPSTLLFNQVSPYLNQRHSATFAFASAGTGAGAQSTDWGQRVFTGTTSGATALARSGSGSVYPLSRGKATGIINFSKVFIISGTMDANQYVANSTIRFTFGKTNTDGTGDLTRKGIGLRIASTGAVELIVHNGTSQSNVTSSFTPTGSTAFDFIIYADGAGNVTLYVNDSSVATSANGPTGDSTNTADYIQLEAVTSAVLSTQTISQIANVKTYIGR